MEKNKTLKERLKKWAEHHAKKKSACCAGGYVIEPIPTEDESADKEKSPTQQHDLN